MNRLEKFETFEPILQPGMIVLASEAKAFRYTHVAIVDRIHDHPIIWHSTLHATCLRKTMYTYPGDLSVYEVTHPDYHIARMFDWIITHADVKRPTRQLFCSIFSNKDMCRKGLVCSEMVMRALECGVGTAVASPQEISDLSWTRLVMRFPLCP